MRTTTKVTLIILSIAVLAGVGYIGFKYFNKTTPIPEKTTNQETGGIQPNEKNLRLTLVSKSPAVGYWMYDSRIYYAGENGQIIKISSDEEKIVGPAEINSMNSVETAGGGAFALASFGGAQNPQLSIFNASSSSWHPLPQEARAASFSQDGKEIAYLEETSGGITSIVLNSLDLKHPRKAASLHILDSNIIWSSSSTVLLLEKPSALLQSTLWGLNIKTGALQEIARGTGLMIATSPYGGLRFSISNNQRLFELTSADGKTIIRSLPFTTLPKKCAFDAKNLYCAVPQNLSAGIVLPDDYLKKKFYSLDTIYQYTLSTGASKIIFVSSEGEAVDATHLLVSGTTLSFVNRYNNIIYSLDLK